MSSQKYRLTYNIKNKRRFALFSFPCSDQSIWCKQKQQQQKSINIFHSKLNFEFQSKQSTFIKTIKMRGSKMFLFKWRQIFDWISGWRHIHAHVALVYIILTPRHESSRKRKTDTILSRFWDDENCLFFFTHKAMPATMQQ